MFTNFNAPPPPPMFPVPPIEAPEYPYLDPDTMTWVWENNAEHTPRGNAWANWKEDDE